MKKLFASTVVALGLLGLTSAACAVPIKWTLTDVIFDDTGTASGSFVYDAETGEYSNIRISTTSGSKGTAANFQTRCTSATCTSFPLDHIFYSSANQDNLTNTSFIDIELATKLPNSPATLGIESIGAATCSNSKCSGNTGDYRMSFSGSLVGTPYVAATPASVPTLNQWSLVLLASLLGVVTFWRQRRRN